MTQDTPHSIIREHFELLGRNRARVAVAPGSGGVDLEHERKQIKVVQLISSYRFRGRRKRNSAVRPHGT